MAEQETILLRLAEVIHKQMNNFEVFLKKSKSPALIPF